MLLVVYAAVVGAHAGLRWHGRWQAEALAAAQLREDVAQANLQALRAQINPHFLFNALTTIGYLIESAPPRALKTLLRLTSLLRSVLKSDGEMTTLGREIELVEHYLDIERERFEERLQVQVDVPEQLRTLAVPCLIVQPLVENAVKHGIARSIRGGEVRVRARLEGAAPGQILRLTVENTGAPLAEDLDGRSSRVGLNNVERRLAGHYGPRASLSLGAADGVTRAEVRVPISSTLTVTDTQTARAAG